MKKPMPLIGLTTSRFKNKKGVPMVGATEPYAKAVLEAGGLPLLIPTGIPPHLLADLLPSRRAGRPGRLDAIIFTGGGDIETTRFNGQPHDRVGNVDPARDELEFALVQQVVEDGVPFLGICRGLQVINVALGGTLFTDIQDQHPAHQKHDYFPDLPRDYLAHPVTVEAHTRLASILGDGEIRVNSLHHQGVRETAAALKPVACAPDGLVEGLELPDHPFGLAVQWHPEWIQELAPMRELFRAFIQAACDPVNSERSFGGKRWEEDAGTLGHGDAVKYR